MYAHDVGPVLLAIALVAYNTGINYWPPFQTAAYVPINLCMTGAVLAIGVLGFGLSTHELGFRWAGAGTGALIGFAIAAPLYALLFHPRGRSMLADGRLAGLSPRGALFYVFVRIPLGTALPEEIAFRGVLFASARSSGQVAAVVVSSIAFGLWHITPTLNLVRANRASSSSVGLLVAGGVVVTAAAGLGFAWLRIVTGSLAAPLALHATVNSASAGASILAHRHATAVTPRP